MPWRQTGQGIARGLLGLRAVVREMDPWWLAGRLTLAVEREMNGHDGDDPYAEEPHEHVRSLVD
jgi:hypothetical protein